MILSKQKLLVNSFKPQKTLDFNSTKSRKAVSFDITLQAETDGGMLGLTSLEVSNFSSNLTIENRIFEVPNSFEEKEKLCSWEDSEIDGGTFKPGDLNAEVMKPVEMAKKA